MKPSERIYQIWIELCKSKGKDIDSLSSMPYHPLAISKYLDEIYEAGNSAKEKGRIDCYVKRPTID